MTEIYKCGDCGNEVKCGAKYCDECGAKLEWPKREKIAKVKIVNNGEKKKQKAESVKLPINPDILYKLIAPEGSAMGDKLYNIILLFFTFGGPILSIMMSRKQKKIYEWLNSLETEESDLTVFRKYIKSFRNYGIWAIALGVGFIVVNVFGLAAVGLNSNFYISSPIFGGIGIFIGFYIKQLAEKILAETEGNRLYAYSFQKESEEDVSENVFEAGKAEDSDDDYDDL